MEKKQTNTDSELEKGPEEDGPDEVMEAKKAKQTTKAKKSKKSKKKTTKAKKSKKSKKKSTKAKKSGKKAKKSKKKTSKAKNPKKSEISTNASEAQETDEITSPKELAKPDKPDGPVIKEVVTIGAEFTEEVLTDEDRAVLEDSRTTSTTVFPAVSTSWVRLILPLSVPALASFAIFQFLWVWNDMLVALVFMSGAGAQMQVVTVRMLNMIGSRGQDWHLLTAGAFVSMILPLTVFLALQRYFVKGLMAGSVKE